MTITAQATPTKPMSKSKNIHDTNPYTAAIERLLQHQYQPFANHAGLYEWRIDSTSDCETVYNVVLAPGGVMEGATCTCKAKEHPACVHRARAFLSHREWLHSPQGQQMTEEAVANLGQEHQPQLAPEFVELPAGWEHMPCQVCGERNAFVFQAGQPSRCIECVKQAKQEQLARDKSDLFG